MNGWAFYAHFNQVNGRKREKKCARFFLLFFCLPSIIPKGPSGVKGRRMCSSTECILPADYFSDYLGHVNFLISAAWEAPCHAPSVGSEAGSVWAYHRPTQLYIIRRSIV
jgi:hypothetical protein